MAITPLVVYVKSTPDDVAAAVKTSIDTKTITHLYGVSFGIHGATAWGYYVYD